MKHVMRVHPNAVSGAGEAGGVGFGLCMSYKMENCCTPLNTRWAMSCLVSRTGVITTRYQPHKGLSKLILA